MYPKTNNNLTTNLRTILFALLPLLAIGVVAALFAIGNPLALFTANVPPIELLTFERIRVTPGGFEVTLGNGGSHPITVAQAMVDDAYYQYKITPSATIPRLGRAKLTIPYPWVKNEPHLLRVITNTGLTFEGEVALATLSPTPGWREFAAYGLLGVYVGILPVGLGMLWFPAMKKMGRKWLSGILAFTVGLLVFLLIDTFLEGIEVAGELPGVFQGIPLFLFAALFIWLVLLTIGNREKKKEVNAAQKGMYLATLIALSIGLHNLGEGLAIGAAFALGEAALGSFLVIGFMLHNVTEGIGIVAPLLSVGRTAGKNSPSPLVEREPASEVGFLTFFSLTLLAGAPAILGAWLGGFAFSSILATLFLGIGLGAIWQVIVEVVVLLRNYASREGMPLASWVNVGGFVVGLAVMYLTAFLVK
jgi:zinc transporter ZupT